jgi:hypothetical protein
MSSRVIIIGAGWYGCYLALQCQKRKIDYVVYEKSGDIFSGASSHNQNRLHLGYHYPRNYKTRVDSKIGFDKFLSVFPELSTKIERNIYSVHKDSIIDFQTYLNIYEHEKYDFEVLKGSLSKNFQGSIIVNERFIDPIKAKSYFSKLKLNIKFHSNIYIRDGLYFLDNKEISANTIINATYGGIETAEASEGFYRQKFLSFIIKKTSDIAPFDALTVMDGPFYSIYPYNKKLNLFTLTHVKYGVIKNSLNKFEIDKLYNLVKFSIKADFPDFDKFFKFETYFTSIKYKPKSATDLRSTIFFKKNNVTTICSGKIDTVFLTDKILSN